MLFLRLLLFVVSFGFIGLAITVVLYDLYLAFELDRILRRNPTGSSSVSDSESALAASQ